MVSTPTKDLFIGIGLASLIYAGHAAVVNKDRIQSSVESAVNSAAQGVEKNVQELELASIKAKSESYEIERKSIIDSYSTRIALFKDLGAENLAKDTIRKRDEELRSLFDRYH